MKRICVFAGSSSGLSPRHAEAARDLGRALLDRRLDLVYGGGNVGLMGVVADTVMAGGGRVIGVIPRPLVDREVAHEAVSELEVVASMHERKARMESLSDGFIALPGGLGTLEELLEIWTWGQLGIHSKPCGLLNVAGYYDRLLDFLDHTVAEGFVQPLYRGMAIVSEAPDPLLDRFAAYVPPELPRWIDETQT